jgi:hypothetical protein
VVWQSVPEKVGCKRRKCVNTEFAAVEQQQADVVLGLLKLIFGLLS